MAQHSPYTPGSPAPQVPGREAQLAAINERLLFMTGTRRMVERPRIDYAPRGYGKTSMLATAERIARGQHRAVTVWVTGGAENPALATLATRIQQAAAGWAGKRQIGSLARRLSVKLTAGIPGVAQLEAGIDPTGTAAQSSPTAEFEELVARAARGAVAHGRGGLVIFIDEIQSMDPASLRTLCGAWQHMALRNNDVQAAIFAAGLPDSRSKIPAAGGITFAERFNYQRMGALLPGDARAALVGPAVACGVGWDPTALGRAVDHAGGYPFALQLIGDLAWQEAGYPDPGATISTDHVARAIPRVAADLESVYESRWNAATPTERMLLAVVASLGDGPQPRAAIERELGRDISDLRDSLIRKGILVAPERGRLDFSVVGFAGYVRQNHHQ